MRPVLVHGRTPPAAVHPDALQVLPLAHERMLCDRKLGLKARLDAFGSRQGASGWLAGATGDGMEGFRREKGGLSSAPMYSRSPSILWLFVAFAYACAMACTVHLICEYGRPRPDSKSPGPKS